MKIKSQLLFIYLIIACASCCKVFNIDCPEGCQSPDSFNYDPNAKESDDSCLSMTGCLGFNGGYTNSGRLTNTFDNLVYDQKMTEEIAIQSQFFDCCPANFSVLVEPSPENKNAYANSNGQILFGYHMFYHTIARYGELAVAGVLAHEWGHLVEYRFNWNQEQPFMELEADAWSGFYMALRKQYAWSQIEGYFRNVYATGDYNFNSPTHHGTPNERINSAYLGVLLAIEILQSGEPLTYQEIHSRFEQAIRNDIAPRYEVRRYEEHSVVYPNDLSNDYIKSLYPFDGSIN